MAAPCSVSDTVCYVGSTVVFAARCYASAAYAVMRCLSVRPSVCLSVMFIHSVKTNKHTFKFFSPSGSHTIPVFPCQMSWRYSDEDPPNGGVEFRWGRQKSQFWAYIWLHRALSNVNAATARCCQHGAAGLWQVVTLYTYSCKRRSLLMAGDDDDKKSQCYAKEWQRQQNNIFFYYAVINL